MTHTLNVGCLAMPMVMGQPALWPAPLSGFEGVSRRFAYEAQAQAQAQAQRDWSHPAAVLRSLLP
jgi:hypothetical protein